MGFLKKFILSFPFYTSIRNRNELKRQKIELAIWERNGKSAPYPHIIKQQVLKDISEQFGLKILVETGTYYGDMIEAMKGSFEKIYSIELSKLLYEKAKQRFREYEHVELICGDSGTEIGNLITGLNKPSLFWLDGHYSSGVTAQGDKDTPILEELAQIYKIPDRRHVVIIDDARCFGSNAGYPSIDKITDFVKSKVENVNIVVEKDSIRIMPSDV